MNYQTYEDYMQSVLGYNPAQSNIYSPYENNYNFQNYNYMQNPFSNVQNYSRNTDDLNYLYPEIYKIAYPIICKVCTENRNKQITKELLNDLTEKVYAIIEPEDDRASSSNSIKTQPLKNGDVRNPNAREIIETRQNNPFLRDLIRILLLREFSRPNRPPAFGPGQMQPPFRPPNNPNGNMRPPFPSSGQMRYDYF